MEKIRLSFADSSSTKKVFLHLNRATFLVTPPHEKGPRVFQVFEGVGSVSKLGASQKGV